MKHSIARFLRRIAEKVEPSHLQGYDITWKLNTPPHVDLRFSSGNRVVGHVIADYETAGIIRTSPSFDAAEARIPSAQERLDKAMRQAAHEAARRIVGPPPGFIR